MALAAIVRYGAAVAEAETWTILRVLKWTQGHFTERNISTARLDAELLLAHVLKKDRVALYAYFDQPLLPDELATFKALIKRRLAGESVAYLLGKKEFYSLALNVDARVLVPRPDTEILVDAALAWLKSRPAPRVIDIGTGSGAIALAVKHARPDAIVFAVDVSPDALVVARQNAAQLALDIAFVEGNLLAAVAQEAAFDLVLSNPPYIPSGDIAGLAAEVRCEPHLALDGGADGLRVIEPLIAAAFARTVADGAFALELGHDQAAAVTKLLRAAGFVNVMAHKDLQGIDRVLVASKVAMREGEITYEPEPENGNGNGNVDGNGNGNGNESENSRE